MYFLSEKKVREAAGYLLAPSLSGVVHEKGVPLLP